MFSRQSVFFEDVDHRVGISSEASGEFQGMEMLKKTSKMDSPTIKKEHDAGPSESFCVNQHEPRQGHSDVFAIHSCFWVHHAEVFELTLQ